MDLDWFLSYISGLLIYIKNFFGPLNYKITDV